MQYYFISGTVYIGIEQCRQCTPVLFPYILFRCPVIYILLQGSEEPQREIRLVARLEQLVTLVCQQVLYHSLEMFFVSVVIYGKPRQSYQGVAQIFVIPRIAGTDAIFPVLFEYALLGREFQTIVIAVSGIVQPLCDLRIETAFQNPRLYGRSGSREDNTFAFLYRHLEIAGNKEILLVIEPSPALLLVCDIVIPVRAGYPFALFVQLEIEGRETFIHFESHSVIHGGISGVGHIVGVSQCMNISKGQKRLDSQLGLGMGIQQCVFNENLFGLPYKHHCLGKYHTSHPVGNRRGIVHFEIDYIFMASRLIHFSVCAYAKIEGTAMLD